MTSRTRFIPVAVVVALFAAPCRPAAMGGMLRHQLASPASQPPLPAPSATPVPLPPSPFLAWPAPAVTQRRPGPDDKAPAYAQDQHWLDGEGQSWAMRDQGQGQTVWLYQEPAAVPVDEIGGRRPVAAYGTRLLTASYGGPALNVVRGSDGRALDIGFLSTGRLDETTFSAFCAATECRVAKWYDQGGGGHDATQDVPIARPVIRLSHRVGDAVSVVWDFEQTSGAPPRFLTLPDTVSIDSGSMGMLWAGRFHNASMISPLIEIGTDPAPFGFGFWDAHGDFYIGDGQHLGEMAGHATSTPSLGLVSTSPDGIVTDYRNRLLEIGRQTSGQHSGGFIGRTVTYAQYGMMELAGLILYDRPLSPRDRFYGLQALGETFGVPQQQQDTYVVDGDSITQGIASLYLQSYQRDMERLLPAGFVFYDAAWAGKTLYGRGGLVDRFGPFTSQLYNPHARNNILSLLAGTNDLQNGERGALIFDLIRQYAVAARHAGFRIVVCSIMPRRTFTPAMEAERRIANTLITGGWRNFADGFVDLANDPVIGPTASIANPNIYISDGIHLTDYGYQTLASDMAGVVNRLIQ